MSLAYRRAAAGDETFVVYSWCASFRSSHTAGLIAMDDWRAVMEPQIRKVLSRPGGEVWVAYHPGETDHVADLYGWLAVERGHALPLVHYVYVKSPFRKHGIARGLFAAAGVDPAAPFFYTCKTYVVHELRHLIPAARWQPLIARRSEDQHHRPRGDHGRHAARDH